MVSRRLHYYVWWRRSGIAVRAMLFALVVGLLFLLVYWQRPLDDEAYLSSNLAVFALVNLNIAILCVLVFLVGRNLAKLFFDRRRGILGSKLRMRLVAAFVGLTLIPTGILLVLASGLLTRATDGWFSSPAEVAVDGALSVARLHFRGLEEDVLEISRDLSLQVQARQFEFDSLEILESFLESRRKDQGLYGIQIVDSDGEVILHVQNVAAQFDQFREPVPSREGVEGSKERATITFEETDTSQFVRAYLSIMLGDQPAVLVVTHRVKPELTQAMTLVSESYSEYEQLKLFKNPLKSVYLLTLYMFTGLILFAAIWFGFYIARELSVPIQRLAEGTKQVARGNYNVHIRPLGDDELGSLVQSFNQMTKDLKRSVEQGERRRIYIETILSYLAVGVVSIDKEQRITSVNQASRGILGIDAEKVLEGLKLSEALPPSVSAEVSGLVEQIDLQPISQSSQVAESELEITSGGRELRLLCSAGKLRDHKGASLGTVLLFDDITTLSRAQQLAAWREAARRIAHEIKNPLTPIQLAAQRLQKIISSDGVEGKAVRESAETIVEHVSSIKRLADEFSKFARMPDADFSISNLNTLISETIAPFAESHDKIVFQFIADSKLPEVTLDREQIRRVLINIIDNAVAAVSGGLAGKSAVDNPRVVIKTRYERKSKKVVIEIVDNGPGIAENEKVRIFQPYFTNRTGGTGLGLAIVASIIADHQGAIRVYDSQPAGTKFIIELPLVPVPGAQRHFAPPE